MNIFEFGIEELKKRGLSENDARTVMEMAVKDSYENQHSLNWTIANRWGDDINDYPIIMQLMVFKGLEPIALQFIMKNCPEAWFRPIFDQDHPLRKEFETLHRKI